MSIVMSSGGNSLVFGLLLWYWWLVYEVVDLSVLWSFDLCAFPKCLGVLALLSEGSYHVVWGWDNIIDRVWFVDKIIDLSILLPAGFRLHSSWDPFVRLIHLEKYVLLVFEYDLLLHGDVLSLLLLDNLPVPLLLYLLINVLSSEHRVVIRALLLLALCLLSDAAEGLSRCLELQDRVLL